MKPISQVFASASNLVFLSIARSWEGNLRIALPASVIAAAISWHFIEQSALYMRHALKALETRYISWPQGRPVMMLSYLPAAFCEGVDLDALPSKSCMED